MSLYVLDTDVLSLCQKNHPQVTARLGALGPADRVAVTALTVEEQISGWYRQLRLAKQPKDLARAYQRLIDCVQFLGRWTILPFSEPSIVRFKALKALRLNVRGTDLAIAAVTLEAGGIQVTRNLSDFQRVPNLVVEDWAA